MKIALFSDVHGHLRVLLRVLQLWQVNHKAFLDAALVAGDLGCFPETDKLDSATRRHLEANPEESGFSRFFVRPRPEIQDVFETKTRGNPFATLRCQIYFIAGNHEDFDYLHSCDRQGPPGETFPVDCYDRFHCIRDGQVLVIRSADSAQFRVGGLWGIARGKPGKPYLIEDSSVCNLMERGKGGFDLLLTHDAPKESFPMPDQGAESIAEIIREVQPPFHLFGHVHPYNGIHLYRLPDVGTESWIMNDLVFGKDLKGDLSETLAILDWDGESGAITQCDDQWLAQMNARTWRSLQPESGPTLDDWESRETASKHLYDFTGPQKMGANAFQGRTCRPIASPKDVIDWVRETGQQPDNESVIPATFVVLPSGELWVADRHSEHVACAAGSPVLAAGEMGFCIQDVDASVNWCTNQSTGYCPSPECWSFVAQTLDNAGIRHPGDFTRKFIFRRCACGILNVVKEAHFYCVACGQELTP